MLAYLCLKSTGVTYPMSNSFDICSSKEWETTVRFIQCHDIEVQVWLPKCVNNFTSYEDLESIMFRAVLYLGDDPSLCNHWRDNQHCSTHCSLPRELYTAVNLVQILSYHLIHFLTDCADSFIVLSKSSRPMRARYKYVIIIWEHVSGVFSNWYQVWHDLMIVKTRCANFVKFVNDVVL